VKYEYGGHKGAIRNAASAHKDRIKMHLKMERNWHAFVRCAASAAALLDRLVSFNESTVVTSLDMRFDARHRHKFDSRANVRLGAGS